MKLDKVNLSVIIHILCLWIALFVHSCVAHAYPLTPPIQGSRCTESDPDFKEIRYPEQIPICNRNVPTWKKVEICKRDGVEDRTNFTVDHLLPLSLSGSNHDDNIWCQHKSINVTHEEYTTYIKLREGEITSEEAIQYILDLKFKRIEQKD